MIRNYFDTQALMQLPLLRDLDVDLHTRAEYLCHELGKPVYLEDYPIWAGYVRVAVTTSMDSRSELVDAPSLLAVTWRNGEPVYYFRIIHPLRSWVTRMSPGVVPPLKPLEPDDLLFVQGGISDVLEGLLFRQHLQATRVAP